jgi:hypothetical protein
LIDYGQERFAQGQVRRWSLHDARSWCWLLASVLAFLRHRSVDSNHVGY